MKTKYPIIVQECPRDNGEKHYKIYCLAPYLNAFNEVIDVFYRRTGWPHPRLEWEVSKGCSGGCDLETVNLLIEGYQIAKGLIEGDTSRVTPKPLVDKFLKAYWKKREKRDKQAGWAA